MENHNRPAIVVTKYRKKIIFGLNSRLVSFNPNFTIKMPSKNTENLRNLSGFLPQSVRLDIINFATFEAQDRFYGACQRHRDYYKDHTGLVKAVPGFEIPTKRNGDQPSPTSVYIKEPVRHHVERMPCVYPTITGRSGDAQIYNYAINTNGRYAADPCRAYRR